MQANWLDIVNEALQIAIGDSGEAVAGAKLRAAVAKIARARSLEFPPEELKKFSNFIRSYPNVFETRRRPGGDFLVAPFGQTHLFKAKGDEPASVRKRFRADIFDALTKIFSTGKSSFYVPATDTIIWLDKKLGAPPDTAIAFPENSTKAELEVRRSFCEGYHENPDTKAALARSLDTETDLKPFTDAIQSNGLVEAWHAFRFNFLENKLRRWAEENGIEWHEEWIVGETPGSQALVRPAQINSVKERQQLIDFCSLLGDEDIPRINIPLDIVLRLLGSK
jgi:hypothetical protein